MGATNICSAKCDVLVFSSRAATVLVTREKEFCKVRIMTNCLLSLVSSFTAVGGNLARVSSVDKRRGKKRKRFTAELCFYHVNDGENTEQWQTEAAGTSAPPTQWEIVHLSWEIERSHWFHLNKSRSHSGTKMDIPCCLALSVLLSASLSVSPRWEEAFGIFFFFLNSTSHWRTVPRLIAALLYHDVVHTWPTAFVNTCSVFLEWHFDRLMLFTCRVSLVIFFYQHRSPSAPPLTDFLGSRGVRGQRGKR